MRVILVTKVLGLFKEFTKMIKESQLWKQEIEVACEQWRACHNNNMALYTYHTHLLILLARHRTMIASYVLDEAH